MTVDDPLLVLFDVVLERRWQLVSARQKTLCRIHDQLTCLLPGDAAKHLTADKTAALLRRIRPTDPVGIRRRLIVASSSPSCAPSIARSPRSTPTSRGCPTSTAPP